ncbi:MAG: 30S ribosomal protein S6 [candidate division KSB1 bacterium]|nr:30S ribosomal protein S6 [candidate division KSB1 bacterium]MDZ7365273.1 30S ribosomal protein S6 [candidate division KSB1 bacterium]MDZ7403140.1 30S ribosomal protein S6 [candidate division KSB1 bacterium]
MKLYETTVVIDSTLKADEVRSQNDKIVNFISNHGGNVVKVDDWGKRRLAYEIKKKQYGFYLQVRFSGPEALPQLLEREYRLNESILRYLTVKVDPLVLKEEQRAQKAAVDESEVEAWDEIPVDVEDEEPVS